MMKFRKRKGPKRIGKIKKITLLIEDIRTQSRLDEEQGVLFLWGKAFFDIDMAINTSVRLVNRGVNDEIKSKFFKSGTWNS